MNQVLKYLTVGLFLLTSVTITSAQKIGYVNTAALLAEIPAVKQANSNLEALQTQLQKKGEGMMQELQTKYVDLQRKEQQGELSPKQLQDEAKNLQEEEAKIRQFEQEMQTQLAEKRTTLIQPILDDLSAKIAEVGKENGYTYILDESVGVILYKDEAFDLTDMVRKKMGL